MVSQLLKNDRISFVVAKPFTSRGKDYAVGDDFPQEEARDIETFVRARFVIPVVDSIEDKKFIRHWHTEIRPKDEVLARLNRDRTQLRMPDEPDSDEVVNIPQLTHPETTPPPEESSEAPEEESGEYDPGDHTIAEVQAYVEAHPDQVDEVRAAEVAGRNRVTLIAWLDEEWEE